MRNPVRSLSALPIFLAAAVPLAAQTCVYDISTGYDNVAGGLTAIGAADDQYTVDKGQGAGAQPTYTGDATTGFPLPTWIVNDSRSSWISSTSNGSDDPGDYIFTIAFDLDDTPVIGEYSLIGQWSTDNFGNDVVINGTSTGLTNTVSFVGWTPFPVNVGKGLFVAGSNTIQFVVNNAAPGVNPIGLRVQACVGYEPAEARTIDISTGLDQVNLVVLPDGAKDSDWTVTGPGTAAMQALVLNHSQWPIQPGVWLVASVQSKWIGVDMTTNGAPGVYTYTIKATIPARFDADVSALAGKFAADDSVQDVLVNGKSTGVTGAGFGAYIAIPDGAGKGMFKAGENEIQFLVVNGSDGANPTGLRVDAQVTVGKRPPPPPECLARISTGWDNVAGAVLATGVQDDDYLVDKGDGNGPQPTYTGGPGVFPIPPWVANTDTSLWISPDPSSNADPGTYTYQITFELPDTVDFSRVALIGSWSADDGPGNVIINGTPCAGGGAGFTAWGAMPVGLGNNLFVAGTNTVQFVVTNSGDSANPSGLRVDACVGVQMPENRPYDISTGFDAQALRLVANGENDPRFTVTGPDGAEKPAVVVNDNAFPIPPWIGTNVQSKWIGAAADSNGPAGQFTYKITVDLDPDLEAPLTAIIGGVAADDQLIDVLVDGQSTGFSAAGFGALTTIPGVGRGLFQTGPNTIEFIVTNGGDGPTGLRIDGQLTVCTPPPATEPKVQTGAYAIDTGYSEDARALIANGDPDDNYELMGPPGSGLCRMTARVLDDTAWPIQAGVWMLTDAQSKWIGTGQASANGPAGDYIFRTQVVLPDDLDFTQVHLVGGWTSDNVGTNVLVNGTPVGSNNGGNFGALASFPVGAGAGLFVPGTNTILFLVNNAGAGDNPVGLRVEGLVGLGPTDYSDLSTGIWHRGMVPLPAGAADEIYRVSGPGIDPARPAVLPAAPGAGWLAASPGHRWIGLDGSDSVGPAGTYTFEVTGTAPPDQNPYRLTLTGGFAAAGRVADVVLNGTSLGLSSTGPGALVTFPAGAGKGLFVSGTNSLQFIVENATAGPTGLLVEARLEPIVEANPLDISTGFDQSTGQVLGDSFADDSYLLTDIDGNEDVAYVMNHGAWPIQAGVWLLASETSKWIGTVNSVNAPPGQYRYHIEFELTAEQAEVASIKGVWAVDNVGDDVLINDQSTGIQNNGGFGAYTAFPADAGKGFFQEGTNWIDFLVTNLPPNANPLGLRVDAWIEAPTAPPPPAPKITALAGNHGLAGTVFQVTGENFDRPGLAVKVGGTAATAVLRADQTTIDVTAPAGALGWAAVEVCTDAGCATEPQGFEYVKPAAVFKRGDADANGSIELTDAITILSYMFLGGTVPTCMHAADADANGSIELTDAITILSYMFLGGTAMPDPGPKTCGPQPPNFPLPTWTQADCEYPAESCAIGG